MSDGCPAVALAKEPPDEDNMRVPPRHRKQPIMTRDWWLFGNLPHTIFEAACVLFSLAMALYICTGSVLLKDLTNMCEKVTVINNEGREDTLRYFCACHEYRVHGGYTGWVTNIDFFNPATSKMVQVLGAARGKIEDLRADSPALLDWIREDMKKGCPKPLITDERGWCRPPDRTLWNGGSQPVPLGLLPSDYYDVGSRGSRMGRTSSFISAVWCEMLRAYTVRTWDWFFSVFNRNPWMHLACSISASLTSLITIIPGISFVFSAAPLPWWLYLFAIGCGFINLLLDELIPKPLYRLYSKRKAGNIEKKTKRGRSTRKAAALMHACERLQWKRKNETAVFCFSCGYTPEVCIQLSSNPLNQRETDRRIKAESSGDLATAATGLLLRSFLLFHLLLLKAKRETDFHLSVGSQGFYSGGEGEVKRRR
ncbi:hypothetical protein Efla_003902 [Eimeria flavescens]